MTFVVVGTVVAISVFIGIVDVGLTSVQNFLYK